MAFYVSGQLLTEDYYVANKLMKGFIGSANIDTNSRLCMASSVAGHISARSAPTRCRAIYEDLEQADLVVLVGSNLAWCHPVLYQRLLAAREARGTRRSSCIDPRRTATAEVADLHLAVAPDSDVALFNGLLDHLDRGGYADDELHREPHERSRRGACRGGCAASTPPLPATRPSPPRNCERFYALFARDRTGRHCLSRRA